MGWNIFNRYIKLHHSSPMNAFKMYDQTTTLKHAQAIPKDFFTVNLWGLFEPSKIFGRQPLKNFTWSHSWILCPISTTTLTQSYPEVRHFNVIMKFCANENRQCLERYNMALFKLYYWRSLSIFDRKYTAYPRIADSERNVAPGRNGV